jgi:hypothetical protein
MLSQFLKFFMRLGESENKFRNPDQGQLRCDTRLNVITIYITNPSYRALSNLTRVLKSYFLSLAFSGDQFSGIIHLLQSQSQSTSTLKPSDLILYLKVTIIILPKYPSKITNNLAHTAFCSRYVLFLQYYRNPIFLAVVS